MNGSKGFWKQIPNATRIYLVLLIYLLLLFCGLVIFREMRGPADGFTLSKLLGKEDQSAQATMTAVALATPAAPDLPANAPWLRAKTNLRVFEGPGEEYPGIAWLEDNQTAEITGRSPDNRWWAIRLPYIEEGSGWVSAEQVETANASNVAVLSPGRETEQAVSTPENLAMARAITNINIRSGPDLRYQKIGTLEIEQSAQIVGISLDKFWYLIKIPGTDNLRGWISKDYVMAQNADDVAVISNLAEAESTVQAGSPFLTAVMTVNMRAGPDVTFAIVGQLDQGQVAEVVGKTEDGLWWAIHYSGAEDERAWVAAAYVEAENASNVPILK